MANLRKNSMIPRLASVFRDLKNAFFWSLLVALIGLLAISLVFMVEHPGESPGLLLYFGELVVGLTILGMSNIYFALQKRHKFFPVISNIIAAIVLFVIMIKFLKHGERLSATDFYLIKTVYLFLFLLAVVSHIFLNTRGIYTVDLVVIILLYFVYNFVFLSNVKLPVNLYFDFFDIAIFDLVSLLMILVIILAFWMFIKLKARYEKQLIKQNLKIKQLYRLTRDQRQVFSENIKAASAFHSHFLVDTSTLNKFFDYFLIYRPTLLISGDFYYFKTQEDNVIIVIGDSIGHGLPASMLSLYVMTLIETIIDNFKPQEPSEVIFHLTRSLKNKNLSGDIDLGIFYFDARTKKLTYLNYSLPAYLVRDNQIITLSRLKRSQLSGKSSALPLQNFSVQLQTGDTLYIMTDGISDFYRLSEKPGSVPNTLKNFLLRISKYPVQTQKRYIELLIHKAARQTIPIDDLTVLGLKVR